MDSWSLLYYGVTINSKSTRNRIHTRCMKETFSPTSIVDGPLWYSVLPSDLCFLQQTLHMRQASCTLLCWRNSRWTRLSRLSRVLCSLVYFHLSVCMPLKSCIQEVNLANIKNIIDLIMMVTK